MKRIASAIAAACLLTAGCGSTAPQKVGQIGTTNQATSAQCRTMSCVLATLPPPNASLKPGSTPTVYGLDFAYGSLSAAGAKAQGARFAASYLSDSSKDWTRAALDSYHAEGLATVAVWETIATRATEGYAAGFADARSAARELAALGAPKDQPFTMAVDCDCTTVSIEGYFEGAHAAVGDQENAYGGYDQLSFLCEHHLVGDENWQTYAWSDGRWLPASCAPLEQYLNGSSFDHDRAIAANYGQWPIAAPKPVVHHNYKRYPTTRRKLCKCSERAVVRSYDRLRAKQTAKHHPHRAELKTLRHDAGLLATRIQAVANRNSVGVWGVSPQWRVYHRSQRYLGLRRREHGGIVPRPKKG